MWFSKLAARLDLMPMRIDRQPCRSTLDLRQRPRPKIPDADVDAAAGTLPILVEMPEQVQGTATRALEGDHRVVAQEQPGAVHDEIGSFCDAVPRQVAHLWHIMVAADQVLAARQCVIVVNLNGITGADNVAGYRCQPPGAGHDHRLFCPQTVLSRPSSGRGTDVAVADLSSGPA